VFYLEPATEAEIAPFPTYYHALRDMLGSLRDPRIGAQWKRVVENSQTERPERRTAELMSDFDDYEIGDARDDGEDLDGAGETPAHSDRTARKKKKSR